MSLQVSPSGTVIHGYDDMNIRSRIDRVEKAIEDAMSEALRYSRLEAPKSFSSVRPEFQCPSEPRSTEEVSSNLPSSESKNDSTPFEHIWESFSSKSKGGADDGKRRIDASVELGLMLFGDSVTVMEEEISLRLAKVENDLEEIKNSISFRRSSISSYFKDAGLRSTPHEQFDQDIDELRSKIEFLKLASQLRVLIDQAEAAALGLHNETKGPVFYDDETLNECLESSSYNEKPRSSQLMAMAKILNEANQIVMNMEHRFLQPSNPVFSPSNHELCYFIFQSLAAPIRRRRLDLQTIVHDILETCIGLKADSIRVQDNHGLLADAWETLIILSELKGSSNRVEDVVHHLAKNLGTIIIEPILSSIQNQSHKFSTWQVSEHSFMEMKQTGFQNKLSSNRMKLICGESWESREPRPTCVLQWSTTWTTPAMDQSNAHRCNSILESFASLLHALQTIFTFIYEKVLCKKNTLSALFGKNLFGAHTKGKRQTDSTLDHEPSVDENSCGQHESTSLGTLLDELVSSMDPSGFIMIQIFQSLKTILWDFCIPDTLDASVLSILSTLADSLRKSTTEFEGSLVRQHFTEYTDILSEHAIHFEEYVAEKQRASLLSECRSMLLKSDYHNTVFVGTDVSAKKRELRKDYAFQLTTANFDCEDDGMVVFILEKAAVSHVAEKLLLMVRQTMESAVDPLYKDTPILSYRLPASLYRTARELLDLYRFVIPSIHEKEISSVPRTAAIFYNDCVYLAHHCLTLGLEYKDRFVVTESSESSCNIMAHLRETCTFVDLVPLFRELADRSMVEMIQSHKNQLIHDVGSRLTYFSAALESNDSVVEWNDAETAQSAGLLHLRNLSRVWRGFLSHDVYGRAMGYLVDAMLGVFLDGIFQAKDISEEACNFTSQLFSSMNRSVVDLFLETPMTMEEAIKDASIYIRNWDRLSAVEKFLSMSLIDITMALSEGVFASITGPELSKLILAVFQDSERRRSLLKQLKVN